MATLLEAATGAVLDPREKARLCRQAEHEFAGVPCGLMDQLASVMGDEAGALLIDCRFEVVRVVPFADPDVSVLICNTNVKHALADGAYARRRTECAEAARQLGVPTLRDATPAMVEAARGILDPAVRRRARHVTTENLRTLAAAAHLEAREFAEVGALMYESHRSLRDDFEVSSAELDTLVDVAREIGPAGGVLGARMTGGGFGGCTVTLVRTEHVGTVAETLSARVPKPHRSIRDQLHLAAGARDTPGRSADGDLTHAKKQSPPGGRTTGVDVVVHVGVRRAAQKGNYL